MSGGTGWIAAAALSLAAAASAPVVRFPAPVVLGAKSVSAVADAGDERARLLAAARSRTAHVFLHLGGVSAARPPGVIWRVRIAGRAVGAVALYGTGIRSEPRFRPARFDFVCDGAIAAALADGRGRIVVTFAPAGPLARPRASVRVERVDLRVG
ncbi:MAG TPA: hypothetical protein VI408_07055 [Gaiellaceae bacterium]